MLLGAVSLLLVGPVLVAAAPTAPWPTKEPLTAVPDDVCREDKDNSVGAGPATALRLALNHPLFDWKKGLVAGITYQVHVELQKRTDRPLMLLLQLSDGSRASFETKQDKLWPACGDGVLVNVPPDAQHIHVAFTFSQSPPTAKNVTFRASLFEAKSSLDRRHLIAAARFENLLIPGCALTSLTDHGNMSWTALEGASAMHYDCHFTIPKPPLRRGLVLTLKRLNIAGAPGNCQDGYLQVGDGHTLCGKLEELKGTSIYLPEPEGVGLEVRVHAATQRGHPVQFEFSFRAVDACYNLTLTKQNSTFVSQVTSDLSCSVRLHVAYGYRVALSLELRPAEHNDVLESSEGDIWDEVVLDDEYSNEEEILCPGLQIRVSGPDGEYWSQCASQVGPVVRLIGRSNQLQVSVTTVSSLDSIAQLHLRYFSIARPELTDDCPGYGWVELSESSCALPLMDRALPWAQAAKECTRKGAHLVSVNSAQVQANLDNILKLSPGFSDEGAFWLGASDRIREGSFRWTDGQPLSYFNWFPGWPEFAQYNKQPSDDGLSEQDCIEMRRSFLVPSSTLPGSVSPTLRMTPTLMWNDRDCGASNLFVCEIQKTGVSESSESKTPATPRREESCNRNITLGRDLGLSPSAVVTSPGFPHSYPDNARCLTRVFAPPGHHVVIDFEELVLEKEPMCSYDYLEISEPDADVPARRLCHDWSGKLKLLRHISKGSELQLLFSSDYSHRFGGFKARVFMENDKFECAESREIKYNSSCYLFIGFPEVTWTTARQVCRGINAELASVHDNDEQSFLTTALRNSEQYSANSVFWLGGRLEANSTQLTWSDQSLATFTAWPAGVQAIREDRCLAVGWQTAPTVGLSSGLYWQAQRCSLVGGFVCQRRIQDLPGALSTNKTVEGTSGLLQSPNFPQAYPANVDYWVKITAPANSRLIVTFKKIDLEPQSECLYDFVAMWNHGEMEPAETVCGTKTEEELKLFRFVSTSNQVLVHFRSDFSISGTGFDLEWKAVQLSGCPEQTLMANEGNFKSPNFPDFLLTNLDCTINILAPERKRVWFHFEEFHVDPEFSNVEISLGNGANFQPFQLKAVASDGTYLSEGESLQIRLRTSASEAVMKSRGFKAVYWAVDQVDEEQSIYIAPNQTALLLPLNWPEMSPESEGNFRFAQKLIAPMGYTIRLTLFGLQVAPKESAESCLEVQDFYSEANGTSWSLCRFDNASTPVTLTSYLNMLLITQGGGDLLNATVSVDNDSGLKQKLLLPSLGSGIDSCTPDPCQNGGHCIAANNNKHKNRPNVCRCPGHFTGPFCALTLCDLSPCMFGTCELITGSFKCNCQPGYRGTNCEQKHRPCLDNPCEGRGDCSERPGGEGFLCRCHAWWEGSRCERRMIKIPFKPLSERMLQEPFWLGLITVMIVLVCIGLVWCAKRHFPEKLEKLLAEEADRSRPSYALSSSASLSAPGGAGGMGVACSPVGAPRNSLLGRLGIRKPSLLSLAPSSPKDGSAPRTFSLDDLLRRTPSPRKKRTNSTPTRKPLDKKKILQQLVTPTGGGSTMSVNSAVEVSRKVSLGELIQMSDKNRRTKSEEGPSPGEAETSLDADPKLEKKVTFARLLDKVSAEMSSGSGSGSPPCGKKLHAQGAASQPDSGSEDVSTTFSGSDPTLPCTSRRLLPTKNTRLSRMSSADSILAMFRTTFNARSSQPSTPSSPQDVSADESSPGPTPASSSAPDSPMSIHLSTIEVPVISSGGNSSSLQHPPTILLEIPTIEYGKCLSPIKEVPTPIPSPAPTPLLAPRRNNSKERVDEDEALRIEVLNPSPVSSPSSTTSKSLPTTTYPALLSPSSAKLQKNKPPTSLQIPSICFPDDDSPVNPVVIPILTVQTPSPPAPMPTGSPPPHSKRGLSSKKLLRDLMADKPGSLELPGAPPVITITNTLSEIESDIDTPAVGAKAAVQGPMCFLSPFAIKGADHRTASESNLSSSGYSSMASPGPSRCGSSNPLCPSEPEEILTPAERGREGPAPPPRKPSPLLRTPAIQPPEAQEACPESNDEGFGTDHLEECKLKLPSIVVETADGGALLSPVSSRSESPLSDRVTGMDRFSPLFYHKSELPYTDSDGLYDCPSSEVASGKQKIGSSQKKKVRRPSSASLVSARGGSTLGGLLEVPSAKEPSFSLQRCHRKSPKRRAARIAPPSSSSSSESLNSFRGNRSSPAKRAKDATSPSKVSKAFAEKAAAEESSSKDDQTGDNNKLWNGPPSTSVTRVARKISRLKTISHQIRFLRRLELSLRRRDDPQQQTPTDNSVDTELSSSASSPTLPTAPAASILRMKARALARRQIPTRIHSRCELATFLLGGQTHQDSD
ncbi:Hypothetical predicted protein [Cloeon dipterum]|uniref:Cubilin n=4 Tax=Cloeon dipterum TaxID=197152 RepID=A0A8S1CTG1_9INSE|nr:Hypothetical predicted protein [Cloeon dipterum]